MKLFKKLKHLADPLHLGKKLAPLLKKGVSLGIKTAPIWSSFMPGGGIASTVLQRGKIGAILARHPKVVGMVTNLRRMRETSPRKPAHNRPSGWNRTAAMVPTNPFLNGRYEHTHMRRLASWNVPYQRGYRAQRNRASMYHEQEKRVTIAQRRARRVPVRMVG